MPQLVHCRCSGSGVSCAVCFTIQPGLLPSLWHLGGLPQGGRRYQNDIVTQRTMARDSGTKTGKQPKRSTPSPIPVEQVSPAVLTASRDVAFTLQQLSLDLDGEEVLKAVLDRAAHLEEQASGITVLED